jgi:replicative DNA helicase
LSDLRESGNIEQAAWRVLSIYRDDYYNLDSNEKGTAEISVLKGKISNTGKVQVAFDKDCTKFADLEWRMNDV